jgi:hypothetical protein
MKRLSGRFKLRYCSGYRFIIIGVLGFGSFTYSLAENIIINDGNIFWHGEKCMDVKSARLQILWSSPITYEPSSITPEIGKPYKRSDLLPSRKGFSLDKATTFPDGRIVFLGSLWDAKSFSPGLLINAEQHGPNEITKLQLNGVQPVRLTFLEKILGLNKPSDIPYVRSLAADGDGTIWIGGLTHYYMDFASAPHSDVYLAKLDNDANPLWERAYKTGRTPCIVGMAPTSTGDLFVVSADSGWPKQSWLALIAASDGHLIWERHLGNGKGIAMVPAQDDRFIVASFDSEGDGATYQENVSVRTISADGQMGSATTIRQAINKESSSYHGSFRMSATEDGAYVVSSWQVSFLSDPSLLKPSEIAKVNAEGKLLWSKILPDSFILNTDRGGATFCSDPAIATLPNGDALVACALNGQIRLHKFDRDTGNDEQTSLSLPTTVCDGGGYPGDLFLFMLKDGTILLSGSRSGNEAAQGCSWLGYLLQKAK